jgi:hypothetical protein
VTFAQGPSDRGVLYVTGPEARFEILACDGVKATFRQLSERGVAFVASEAEPSPHSRIPTAIRS